MPPRREPRHSNEPSFPDIAQLGEAIANAIQSSFRLPQRTPLETVYNLKLNHFMGNEGHEGAEKWLNHVKKTFLMMQSQGILQPDRWVEMTNWFLGPKPASWFIPPKYIDRRKQEFTYLKQGKMSANAYYRRFTDFSRYDPEVAANPIEMLRRFRLGTKKKWRSITTLTPCATYQEFYEVLLRIEDSKNMPSESEDEGEKNVNQRRDDKGKGQSSQGPCKTQNFKRSGVSFSSSSGGLSSNVQRKGGRFSGGSKFQRQRDFGGSGAPLCRRSNNRHFGECRRGSNACYACGKMGHRAAQ
ncbi:hypothetical protein ACFX2K_047145 [Malus domestica]